MIRLLVTLVVLAYAIVLFAAVAAVGLVVLIVMGGWKAWEWWVDRRCYVDECEVCAKPLTEKNAVVLSATRLRPDMGGGTTITATYCKPHAPEEAS